MANAVRQTFGAINNAGASDALFLKVFGGEVITAYEELNVFAQRTARRNISSGKSAAFPATWKVNAAYHTPGVEILGQTSPVNERVINTDDMLIADVFIAQIDEAKSHYEVRSEYSKQCGAALARNEDRNLAQVGLLAARAAATVTGGFGGTALTDATFLTSGSALAAGIFAAATAMDEKDVPESDRFAYVRPAQYALMAQTTNVINKDWNGAGSYSEGSVIKVANVSIVKTNNLPKTNVTTGPAAYQGNFTTVAALVMNRAAVGTVKLLDLSMEMEWDIRRQGTLMLAKYAIGHGILRPECAVELKTA